MDVIEIHNESAAEYENHPQSALWHVPDYIFGMCYEYLLPGQKLLDIGTGTGLSVKPFSKYELTIHGIDGSAAMLDICREKGICEKLFLHDLLTQPWPVDKNYDLAISAGVLHFFNELYVFFKELDHLLTEDGVFCFTVMNGRLSDRFKKKPQQENPVPLQGLPVHMYIHSEKYIKNLAEKYGYEILKCGESLMKDEDTKMQDDFFFSIYVLKRKGR